MLKENKVLQDAIFDRYRQIKQSALDKIIQLSGNNWSDFYLHDPGITILEQIIEKLIELEFNASIEIGDLLQKGIDSIGSPYLKPHDLIPLSYSSLNDIRSTIVDTSGIRNAKVILDTSSDGDIKYGYEVFYIEDFGKYHHKNNQTSQELQIKLDSNRKLGEKTVKIAKLVPFSIYLDLSLQLEKIYSSNEVNNIVANIFYELQNFFVPTIEFASKQEATFSANSDPTEVYKGPLLEHGFIYNINTKSSEIIDRFNSSDLVKIISSVQGVRTVFSAKIFCEGNESCMDSVKCKKNEFFDLYCSKAKISLLYKSQKLDFSLEKAIEIYQEIEFNRLISKRVRHTNHGKQINSTSSSIPYSSIQNSFPAIYAVGAEGLSKTASTQEKENNSLTKAYLTIFDQILYDYFSIVNAVENLLNHKFDGNLENFKFVIPNDIPNPEIVFKKIIHQQVDKDDAINIQKKYLVSNIVKELYSQDKSIVESATHYVYSIKKSMNKNLLLLERSKEFLLEVFGQHNYPNVVKLLAEDEASYLKLKIAYQSNLLKTMNSREYSKFVGVYMNLEGQFKFPYLENISALLDIKLKDYKVSEYVNNHFIKADIHGKFNDIDKISIRGNFLQVNYLALYFGIKKKNYIAIRENDEVKIRLMLNSPINEYIEVYSSSPIKSTVRANIVIENTHKIICDINSGSETMYVVEHSLLVDDSDMAAADLFSITVIFPAWPARFQDEPYRETADQVISENTPAHLHCNILWLDIEEMQIFENSYFKWINLYSRSGIDKKELEQARKNLFGILKMYIMG